MARRTEPATHCHFWVKVAVGTEQAMESRGVGHAELELQADKDCHFAGPAVDAGGLPPHTVGTKLPPDAPRLHTTELCSAARAAEVPAGAPGRCPGKAALGTYLPENAPSLHTTEPRSVATTAGVALGGDHGATSPARRWGRRPGCGRCRGDARRCGVREPSAGFGGVQGWGWGWSDRLFSAVAPGVPHCRLAPGLPRRNGRWQYKCRKSLSPKFGIQIPGKWTASIRVPIARPARARPGKARHANASHGWARRGTPRQGDGWARRCKPSSPPFQTRHVRLHLARPSS